MSSGAELIAAERVRQIGVEGYTLAHDSRHATREFVAAAGAYLGVTRWPWAAELFKPDPTDDGLFHERDLVKAAALIAAAIDAMHTRDAGEDQ